MKAPLTKDKKGVAAAEKAAAEKAKDDHETSPVPNPEDDPTLKHLPPNVWECRRQQQEALRNILYAYYHLPRMQRERRAPRPTSSLEMQHEVDEAMRLSTPVAELLANAERMEKLGSATPGKSGKEDKGKPAQKASGKPPKATGKKTIEVLPERSNSVADSELHLLLTGELNPVDFLNLPVPRALAPRVMNRVLQLRSRRIRLEAAIEVFQSEIGPLEDRLRCITDMRNVGQYSLSAVGPLIQHTTDLERELQQLRVQEDEEFSRTRARAATPQQGGRR